jgi:putative membrane protein
MIVKLLLWAHLVALALGVGGGLGMSQVGPRLVNGSPDQREIWWPLARVFRMLTSVGLVVLLVTGPLMVWLKYGGFAGMNVWFQVKMGLVALGVVLMGLSEMGMARVKRGDEGGGKLAMIAGPALGVTMYVVMLAAVFAFN